MTSEIVVSQMETETVVGQDSEKTTQRAGLEIMMKSLIKEKIGLTGTNEKLFIA